MEFAELIELRDKYNKELVFAQAKVAVIEDIIEMALANSTDEVVEETAEEEAEVKETFDTQIETITY